MRVLLDECVNPRLARILAGHEVSTVAAEGWKGIKNGSLLALAGQTFDVLVTLDRGIEHEQNRSAWRMGVVVVRTIHQDMASLRQIASQIKSAIRNCGRGPIVTVVHPDLQ